MSLENRNVERNRQTLMHCQTEHQRMSHSVQVILILCLSTLHQSASAENENYNHTEFVSENETLELFEAVTTCEPSPPFLVTEPPASIIGHEGSLITVTIVFCDIVCDVDNVSISDMGFEDVNNMTCGVLEDTSCERDTSFDDISANFTDSSNTTVTWTLSGVTLFPGTWQEQKILYFHFIIVFHHPRYGGLESLPLTPDSPGCLVSRLLLLPDSEMGSWLLLSVTSDRGSLERRVQMEIRPPIMSPFLVCIDSIFHFDVT